VRRRLGLVFQAYNLFPHLTALQNIVLGDTRAHGASRAEADGRANRLLERFGLAGRGNDHPDELSGGQQQRVAIARAIVADPTFLLCDEPTGDLDRAAADEILNLLTRLCREHGKTILMVTHDPRAAERADVVLHLDKGVLREAAAAEAAR